MKLRREVFVVVFVITLLLNDPQLLRAHSLEYATPNIGWVDQVGSTVNPFLELDDTDEIHLAYALNGGTGNANPITISRSELPYVLEIPQREGYNFAGWYTDSNYQNKITVINHVNAGNMVLFAKWTKEINNRYNVEMYSYQATGSANLKELKDCNYDFLDNVMIPGMPSTREQDYREHLISSEAQCMQGLCFTPEFILMTSYSEDAEDKGSLMVFDRENGTYLVTLGMKEESHLGGIAYDGDSVWVCHSNSKTLERIPYEYIKQIASAEPGYCVDASALTDEYRLKNTPSSITYYGGRIWVATHTKLLDSEMVSYTYDKESNQLLAVSKYCIPSKVQGIAFDEDGAVYLSTSYGRNNSSYLKVYSSLLALTQKPDSPTMKVEMPPCSEQIAIAGENIYVIFESASRKYFEGTDGNGTATSPIDKILEVDVASIW